MNLCGACKYQRRRCGKECLFALYFPAENIQRFACVHHVFGGGNVGSMLKITKPELRGWLVKTLEYQAEARVRDPVQGCLGLIWDLEQNLRMVKEDLAKAQSELAQYMGPEFVQKLSPSYGGGSSSNCKAVALPQPVMVGLDAAPSMGVDLDEWDPFPPWETIFENAGIFSSSSSQMQHPKGEGGNGKGKSVAPSSS